MPDARPEEKRRRRRSDSSDDENIVGVPQGLSLTVVMRENPNLSVQEALAKLQIMKQMAGMNMAQSGQALAFQGALGAQLGGVASAPAVGGSGAAQGLALAAQSAATATATATLQSNKPKRELYVKNVPYGCTSQHVRAFLDAALATDLWGFHIAHGSQNIASETMYPHNWNLEFRSDAMVVGLMREWFSLQVQQGVASDDQSTLHVAELYFRKAYGKRGFRVGQIAPSFGTAWQNVVQTETHHVKITNRLDGPAHVIHSTNASQCEAANLLGRTVRQVVATRVEDDVRPRRFRLESVLTAAQCEAVMEGHAGAVLALAVARDDQRLYSVGAEGDVVGWRVRSTENVPDSFAGYVLFRVAGAHRGAAVRCVAVTPGGGGADQGTLFTGGEDGYVRAWRAADGAPLCALAGHNDWVGGVATCAFGKTLCSASHDGSIIAWRVGKMTRRETTLRFAAQGFLDAIGTGN